MTVPTHGIMMPRELDGLFASAARLVWIADFGDPASVAKLRLHLEPRKFKQLVAVPALTQLLDRLRRIPVPDITFIDRAQLGEEWEHVVGAIAEVNGHVQLVVIGPKLPGRWSSGILEVLGAISSDTEGSRKRSLVAHLTPEQLANPEELGRLLEMLDQARQSSQRPWIRY